MFEDISLGENRPTQLVRRYGNLYAEARLDALDALDELVEVAQFKNLKGKLLLSVVVVSNDSRPPPHPHLLLSHPCSLH